MKPFSLLIKPASADCNLRCNYCFYIDHLEGMEKRPRMSEEVLDAIISSYMKLNQGNSYSFGWQGGEPTLMDLNFFKKVVELQKKYGTRGTIVQNGLQTNATLISNEMAKFFSEYKFLIGVSLDGPKYFHDYYRKTLGHAPTYDLVMRGIEHLKQNNVEFNILTLVNNLNVKKPKEIYQYHKNNDFFYHQYIPCVEYDEFGKPYPFSITGEEWGNFLCIIFDEWIKYDVNKISVRLFDCILEYILYNRYNICSMQNNCCQYFVVEYDGNIYPCDFFVRKDLLLGNIRTTKWSDLLKSPIYKDFGQKKAQWNNKCRPCSYLKLCHGGCQKHRKIGSHPSKNLSVLCTGWKQFYKHAFPRFKILAEKIKNEQKMNILAPIKSKKIGRNEKCPCGSGKKYKNCCL